MYVYMMMYAVNWSNQYVISMGVLFYFCLER